eukprot:TRINITY_DN1019_c0_g1_i4.p1 TRINITY_DN1019_c0_g1~~TRINITY_DN1019_c0_g1_i4.p1  ORF type:complete len:1386 (-),score=536.20 TRINITY_DN1019_c0_g1_i4:27-4184(-)
MMQKNRNSIRNWWSRSISETSKKSNSDRIMLLEVGQYLENYLWKNWTDDASFAHLMSILLLVNEKFRENVNAWECFHGREEEFSEFFEKVLSLKEDYELSFAERTSHILFLINTFQSLEDKMVRDECLKLVSIHLWRKVNPILVEKEIGGNKKLTRFWKKTLESAEESEDEPLEHFYLYNLIQDFFTVVESVGEEDQVDKDLVRYCERFAEWMIDLLSQLPTRRFFRLLFESSGFVTRCKGSNLAQRNEGILFNQLLDMLRFYQNFEVDDITGRELNEEEVDAKECSKIKDLQRVLFTNFPNMKELAFSSVSTFQEPSKFRNKLKDFTEEELKTLAKHLGLFSEENNGENPTSDELLKDRIVETFQKRLSQLHAVNEMALYPTEGLLWNDNAIPTASYEGESSLALPKLNLQFLTFYDYLLRNYDLYRLESAYQIRSDVEDSVRRMAPRKEVKSATQAGKGETVITRFGGWSKMALLLQDFSITNVADPKLGESKPSKVEAEAVINLSQCKGGIRREWESIKQHDVVFLVTVRATKFEGEEQMDVETSIRDQIGVKYVRGASVREIVDEEGHIIKDSETERTSKSHGNVRKLRLNLDTAQYRQDLEEEEDVYGTFNLLIRRKSKENNFKAVLETIRDLMNSESVLPDWLRDIFLGYGDPNSGSKEREDCTLNFNDTFLSGSHFIETHPHSQLEFFDANGKEISKKEAEELSPPFRVEFENLEDSKQKLKLRPYLPSIPGPYPHNIPRKNSVPFTVAQLEAIERGMFEGLTMVVGPPGTGKTDVAVQMISNWYHSFPEQRILIVTHSNQALNQIFEKIMHLDIDERHLLRLGHGQESLETEKDFSKFGRVNHMLARRLDLLNSVDRLAKSLGILDDVAYTCETAESFWMAHILPKINEFRRKMKEERNQNSIDVLAALFPFTKFFADAPQPLLRGKKLEEDMRKVEGCLIYISNLFVELKECRAFELLRSSYDRSNYLLTKQARIVAMTVTHASLKRSELISLGFKYDNLIMEEAAQILEIEAFIPMLLQEVNKKAGTRLKRVVLIGDHHQLPPVVKNIAFQKYSHLDQSLFTRFVRLGVPTVQLDSQGRARSSLAKLYNWRYKNLTDLPNTLSEEFKLANAGLKWDFQFVDVGDYDGKGETAPSPYFYQNLGEAEYVVALYMYMRLIGYPAKSIAILTTYNGQKNLIRDVFRARTGWTRFFGNPSRITTVDRYQGQQADYVLLSLVRTKAVGHLRDVRRLVVAMSRARLGLYVFGRHSLFDNCYELTRTFSQFKSRPNQLVLVQGEEFPSKRKLGDESNLSEVVVQDVIQMGNIIASLQQKIDEKIKRFDQEEMKNEEWRRLEVENKVQAQNDMVQMEDTAEMEMEAKIQHMEEQQEMEEQNHTD